MTLRRKVGRLPWIRQLCRPMQVDEASADQMLDKAIQTCAEPQVSRGISCRPIRPCNGPCEHLRQCLPSSLVRQIGEYLGQVDRTVKAVYQYEPEFAALQLKSEEQPGNANPAGINLVAWVERKSAALIRACGHARKCSFRQPAAIRCRNAIPACYILDIQMIDDRDVNESRGYGLMVNSRLSAPPSSGSVKTERHGSQAMPAGGIARGAAGAVGFVRPGADPREHPVFPAGSRHREPADRGAPGLLNTV